MKEISFKEAVDETIKRLEEEFKIPLPKKIIYKFIKHAITKYLYIFSFSERMLVNKLSPITTIKEIHDGSKYLYKIMDLDETKMLSRKEIRLSKDALSMEMLTERTPIHGTEKKVFRYRRYGRNTTVFKQRHIRYGTVIGKSYLKRNSIPISKVEKKVEKASHYRNSK